jgi:hypothetical protein
MIITRQVSTFRLRYTLPPRACKNGYAHGAAMVTHKYHLDTAHKSKLLSEQRTRMHVSAIKQALTTLNTLLCCADTGSQASIAICFVLPQLELAAKTVSTVLCTLRLCMTMAHYAKALTHQELFCAFRSVDFRKFSTACFFFGLEGTMSHFNEWLVSASDPSQNSIVLRVTIVVTFICLLIH